MHENISKELLNAFRAPAFNHSYFLSFEGIEGSGKSTQIIRTKEFLESKDFRVLILREPGGTNFGEQLRMAILHAKNQLHPLAEAYLFAASRAQLLHEVVIKELSIPKTIIICDRYLDSTLVYQGKARNLGHRMILEIHQHFPLNLVPHRTYLLEVGLGTSKTRLKMRNNPKDYFEAQGDTFYRKLIDGYQEVKDLFPERVLPVNGEQEGEKVFQEIKEDLLKIISASLSEQ